jgi:hypothetical protein
MEGIQFSSGKKRFGGYLRNVGRKEGVDIHLARLYNVATLHSFISNLSIRQVHSLFQNDSSI